MIWQTDWFGREYVVLCYTQCGMAVKNKVKINGESIRAAISRQELSRQAPYATIALGKKIHPYLIQLKKTMA